MSGIVSRRNLLKLGAGAVGTGVLTAGVGSQLISPPKAIAQNNISPDQALKQLLEGNKRFGERKRKNPHQSYTRIAEVAKGQKPFASILGCADSRVPAEIIFDQGFGDLFVCRVAGNVATPEEIGSLEFGSLELGAKVIMVLGHERCGAVTAAIKGGEVPGQIGSLVAAIQPSVEQSKKQPGDKLENACKANVMAQIENLKKSTVLAQLIQENKLKIVGGYYDLDTGKVTMVS
ncbi:MAG: carbonic anhydrase [Pelatocladus maniniholoensis HA4357-MV3]|jgi:carbonic anhydrase|uniref:carbonic anhydrase n=1 Tax=Pelatocladus maniniholoensis HA4357-MV3 TaxID=1117104 RepID=A0A9E3H3W2_9NOST|nr:carbonic anhydrase [Pelatocladus maniniholoensis HA4357-MV3]BAZ69476.1 carbonic anhydrase [Fischerella sp. NIES-4106]